MKHVAESLRGANPVLSRGYGIFIHLQYIVMIYYLFEQTLALVTLLKM